ncbi:uncharacterized protein LOC128230880 [Mya arenaria]|uniref:uncharacterized protein LOC128230880 n=1 Tax=Mya arenaria TaxID=6604 RepID=UPI0022E91211|nr:uncharacterized protein LOC128230880 [Mya arenaria]
MRRDCPETTAATLKQVSEPSMKDAELWQHDEEAETVDVAVETMKEPVVEEEDPKAQSDVVSDREDVILSVSESEDMAVTVEARGEKRRQDDDDDDDDDDREPEEGRWTPWSTDVLPGGSSP